MHSIEVFNQTSQRLPGGLIVRTLDRACRRLKIKNPILAVVVATPAAVKKLNAKYRGQNKATDVLSFAYEYDKNGLDGEIIICYAIAKAQAAKHGQTVVQEIIKLTLHGLLHLIGYDHHNSSAAREMFQLEDEIIDKLKK